MEPNIVFSHVTKTYKGGVTALEDVSFSVGSGVFGLLGHNGAGKTTLARCLCGLMKEQAGTILWDESPLGRKERRRKAFLIMQDVNLQLFGDSVLAEARLGSTATEQEALAAFNADPERWKNCPDMMDCDPWTPPAPEPEEEAETRNA